VNSNAEGKEIDSYLERLFPIARSLTGEGNRKTFRILQEIVPLEITEYPSGTTVYDWTVPDEWVIRDAYIKTPDGRRLVDYSKCNLHVVGYSGPINQKMTFSELAPRLHMLEGSIEAIPYRTSYYSRDWGFCITETQFKKLESTPGLLEVCIDSELNPKGAMTVGELRVQGESDDEYLVSTYCCHPSMANDNLSGLLTSAFLARDLWSGGTPHRSWRFVFVPETIGAIAYLCHNEAAMKTIHGGLVVATCGGTGPLGYKESYLGDNLVDRAIRLAFRDRGIKPVRYSFVPDGSDERQYSSPGFRIPIATITRDKYYEYPQYHTSLDNLDFVKGDQIVESLALYRDVVQILDQNACYLSNARYGEPQLGRRGLYPSIGGGINQRGVLGSVGQTKKELDATTWLLFMADGTTDVVDVAERSGVAFSDLVRALKQLVACGLLEPVLD
jgi:aminopeptidase-like protein